MACVQDVIIKEVSWNGIDLGHAVAYSIVNSPQRIAIQSQGHLGYSCRPIVGRDVQVVVDFLDAPPFDPAISGASLVIKTILSDGVTVQTKSFDTMIADGWAEQHQDRTAGRWSQTFLYIGDYDTENMHIS